MQPTSLEDGEQEMDTIKASPARGNLPARFDTVVVLYNSDAESTGLAGELLFIFNASSSLTT
jgi:hypothetical protein